VESVKQERKEFLGILLCVACKVRGEAAEDFTEFGGWKCGFLESGVEEGGDEVEVGSGELAFHSEGIGFVEFGFIDLGEEVFC